MDLGTFRKLTKDLSDTTELAVYLGVTKREREELFADVVTIDLDQKDNKGCPYIAILIDR